MNPDRLSRSVRRIDLAVVLAVVVLGTLVHFCARRTLPPVFNETAMILEIRDRVEDRGISSPGEYFSRYWKDFWVQPSDRPVQPFYYRPLESIWVSWIILQSHIFHHAPALPVLVSALSLAAAAGLTYLAGWRLTKDRAASAAAAVMMLLFLPSVTSTWVATGSVQAWVPLLVCLVVLCYERYKRSGSLFWTVPILAVAYFAPLYKEYTSTAVMTVFALECLEFNKNRRFLLILLPFFLNAYAPAWFINRFCYGQTAVSSTFVSAGILENFLVLNWRTEMIARMFYAISPLLVVLGVAGVLFAGRLPRAMSAAWKIFCLSVFILALAVPVHSHLRPAAGCVILLAMAGITWSVWRTSRILAVWMLFSWVPFLFVSFVSESYFVYAIGPVSIALFHQIGQLVRKMAGLSAVRPKMRFAMLAVALGVGLAGADQVLNISRVHRMFRDTAEAGREAAAAILRHEEAIGSAGKVLLVSDNRLAKDVRYLLLAEGRRLDLNEHPYGDPYYESEDQLKEVLVREGWAGRHFYLMTNLNVTLFTLPFLDGLAGDYRHRLLLRREKTIRFPFLDPSRCLIPQESILYPGTPDMRYTADISGGLFWTQVRYSTAIFVLWKDPPGDGK
ncbi:MAG: hypothetical protein Q8Q08_07795 [Candidatus Omnitrophota bacterium]|nr:hypothetical protein [Candidatus Omnitrophota bacterium]MDZ4241810.1 hypothetical protein [Candidatus Omnitrophota bacterium]